MDGRRGSIRHLVMPNHVECCTYPVLDWIAEHTPTTPVNVMAQFHPDNFCGPGSSKYRRCITRDLEPSFRSTPEHHCTMHIKRRRRCSGAVCTQQRPTDCARRLGTRGLKPRRPARPLRMRVLAAGARPVPRLADLCRPIASAADALCRDASPTPWIAAPMRVG